MSTESQDSMPLSAFQARQRPNRPGFMSPNRFITGVQSPKLGDLDSILDPSLLQNNLNNMDKLGGFPVKFLSVVSRLTKILRVKRRLVMELSDMNTEAEKTKSHGKHLSVHFRQKYASTVLDLERLNKDLNEYLVEVQ